MPARAPRRPPRPGLVGACATCGRGAAAQNRGESTRGATRGPAPCLPRRLLAKDSGVQDPGRNRRRARSSQAPGSRVSRGGGGLCHRPGRPSSHATRRLEQQSFGLSEPRSPRPEARGRPLSPARRAGSSPRPHGGPPSGCVLRPCPLFFLEGHSRVGLGPPPPSDLRLPQSAL